MNLGMTSVAPSGGAATIKIGSDGGADSNAKGKTPG